MGKQHVYLALVPLLQLLSTLIRHHLVALKLLRDPRNVVLVLVEHQHTAAIRGLHYLLQLVQLLMMNLMHVALIVIHGAVGELAQLVHQPRRTVRQYVRRLVTFSFSNFL